MGAGIVADGGYAALRRGWLMRHVDRLGEGSTHGGRLFFAPQGAPQLHEGEAAE
jgi:hypothetical protein